MNLTRVETESKFSVPDVSIFTALRQTTRLDPFELKPLDTQKIVDRYLDTGDKRLFQAGYACRIRAVNGKKIVGLKSLVPADGNIHRRQEIEAEIATEQPQAWADSEAKRLVLKIVGRAPLKTVFVLNQTRHRFQACFEDRPVIEFSLDRFRLEDAPGLDKLEVEAELIETGTEADLAMFTRALQSRWDLQAQSQSKFEWAIKQKREERMAEKLTEAEKRTLHQIAGNVNKHLARRAMIILLSDADMLPANIAGELELTARTIQHWQREFNQKRLNIFPEEVLMQVSNQQGNPPTEAIETAQKPPPQKIKRKKITPVEYPVRKNVGLEPTDSLAEAGRKVLGFHFGRMLKHEPGTRLGEDIEALHDMRVATRRMRAALRVFGKAYSKKKVKPLQQGLKATAKALGPVRDLDVFMEKLKKYQQELPEEERAGLDPLLQTWSEEREVARERMLAYLDSKSYAKFKQNFLVFVDTEGWGAKPIPTDGPVPYQLRHIVPGLIYERYEAVVAYETILQNASLETLHQLRLTFKRFRYTLEYFREILGKEAKGVIDEIKALQDHLGDMNDADVASRILRDYLANWEQYQLHLPLVERQSPTAVVNYLNSKLEERHQLVVTFPETWANFNRPDFRRNLALAIAEL